MPFNTLYSLQAYWTSSLSLFRMWSNEKKFVQMVGIQCCSYRKSVMTWADALICNRLNTVAALVARWLLLPAGYAMRHPVNIETDCQTAQLQCDVDNNPLALATGCSGSSSSRPPASFALCTGPIGTDADLPLPAGIALWLIWPGHWSYITFAKFRSMLQIKFGCTRTRDLPSRPDPTRPVPDPRVRFGYG